MKRRRLSKVQQYALDILTVAKEWRPSGVAYWHELESRLGPHWHRTVCSLEDRDLVVEVFHEDATKLGFKLTSDGEQLQRDNSKFEELKIQLPKGAHS